MNHGKFDQEAIVYDCTDYEVIVSDLECLETEEPVRIDVNAALEEAFAELNSLKEQLSQSEGEVLIDQCKTTILETITGQFGLASMFIDCKDGGNVTTTHNFAQGIAATEADRQRYDDFKANNDGSKDWQTVRKDGGYDSPLPSKRKEAFKNQETIIDEYTGRPLPKDGRAHLDHVVSAKEIESKPANHLHLSPEERARMATADANLAWTEASANQSKGELPMQEWLKKEDKGTGQTNAERFAVDERLARESDAAARKAIKKQVNVAAVKKYSQDLLVTGGKDAAKMAAYSAVGVILRDFVQGAFSALKETFANRGHETMKEIFLRFKEKLSGVCSSLKSKWKDILSGSLGNGITAFLSNLLVFVINLFATTLKKIVSMIRAGFVSLVKALKTWINPPAGMSQDEARYQAVKILTAGLIGAASLGLAASIEKFLQAIPGLQPLMFFPIPSFGGQARTVSDILAITLSALLGGLLTTITLYFMDRFRNEGKRCKLQIQLVYQSGIVVDFKSMQSWLVLRDAYWALEASTLRTVETILAANNEIQASQQKATEAVDEYAAAVMRLKRARV